MLPEILALILGILVGTIAGLLPGVHVNLISVFLLSILNFFLNFTEPIVLAIFIVAMTISDTFVSFIPSIFLGAPDEDTVLSVLPGHEMLNKGKGYEAVIYTLYGSILGIIIILLFTPIFIFILPYAYPYIKTVMFFILLFASIYLISREKSLNTLIIFMLAGFLGLATLNLNTKESLLPLLTGLFGASSLITSIIKKKKLPEQIISPIKNIKITKKDVASLGIAAILSAPLCSFMPALGSGQAAVIGTDVTEEKDRKKFLVLLGSINTIVAGLAFVALYSIHVTRTGTSVALSKILGNFSFHNLLIILTAIIISGIAAAFLTIFLAKFFAKNISKLNYQSLSIFILLFISAVVIIFSGFLGFLIFIIATFTGLTCILTGVRRTNLMASLMLPAILLYLPF